MSAGEVALPSVAAELRRRLLDHEARIVTIGGGYAGLPLAVELAECGFPVVVLDRDGVRVAALAQGQSYLADLSAERIRGLVEAGRLGATSDEAVLRTADVVLICVPTPLNKTREPDLGAVREAVAAVSRELLAPQLVVLESTTYPGTTRDLVLPLLEEGGRQLDRDFFLAFSPERVDPGNRVHGTRNTPKVLGGTSAASLALASALYGQIIDELVPVSTTDTAEMVKLLENTFRAVNIALANETAILCRHLGLDVFEVIRAAATKPFGFMPFFPGPGLGGHCLPVDPLYLSWKVRSLDHRARFIELADAVNSAMPEYVVGRIADALNDRGLAIRGSRILLYGVAYKRDVQDVRESPALELLRCLERRGALLSYEDPWVPSLRSVGFGLDSLMPGSPYGEFDAVVVVTDHSLLERERLLREASLIVDTRDALHGVPGERQHVYGL